MADTVQTLGVAGRPTTPSELLRQISPDQPVLLVGPDAIWESTGVAALPGCGGMAVGRARPTPNARPGSPRSSGCRWCSWRATPPWCGRRSRRCGRSRWPRSSCWPMLRPPTSSPSSEPASTRSSIPRPAPTRCSRESSRCCADPSTAGDPACDRSSRVGCASTSGRRSARSTGSCSSSLPPSTRLLTFLMTHPGQALPDPHDRPRGLGLVHVRRQERAAHLRESSPPEAARRLPQPAVHRVGPRHRLSLHPQRRRDRRRRRPRRRTHRRHAAAPVGRTARGRSARVPRPSTRRATRSSTCSTAPVTPTAWRVFRLDGNRMQLVVERQHARRPGWRASRTACR